MATEEAKADSNEVETKEEQQEQESKTKNFLGVTKKQRKRELKFIADEIRDVPADASDEDKLIALFRKFQLLGSENRELMIKMKQSDKRASAIAAERDQYLDNYSRVTIQKEKLETLCRELQKQNHLIRDQSLAMAQSEDEKRKEMADRFQAGITEIQTQLNDYLDKNNSLREENQMLAEKLQKFISEHEKREDYIQKLLKTRDLETKLAEAKVSQAKAASEQALLAEKRETMRAREEMELLKQRLDAHALVENKLKEQIEFYKTKYQSFNKTMARSNELIENTKKEMEKMTKHVRAAESAALEWRSKWEMSQKALLEMIEECSKEKEKALSLQKQVDSLSKLCRALRGGAKSKSAEGTSDGDKETNESNGSGGEEKQNGEEEAKLNATG